MPMQQPFFFIILAKVVEVTTVKQLFSAPSVLLEMFEEVVIEHPDSFDGLSCKRFTVLADDRDLER